MTLRRTPANRFLSTFSRTLLIPNGSRSGSRYGESKTAEHRSHPRQVTQGLNGFAPRAGLGGSSTEALAGKESQAHLGTWLGMAIQDRDHAE